MSHTISTAAAIVNYAEKEKVDLITIGTRGRTGIIRMLLGNVAQSRGALCPRGSVWSKSK